MAIVTKINPVIDGNAGAFFGKDLNYLEITFAPGNVATSVGPNGAWPTIISQIEAVSSIEVLGQLGAINQLSNSGNLATCGVRVLTTGVQGNVAANLQPAIQALGNAVGTPAVNVAATTVSPFVF